MGGWVSSKPVEKDYQLGEETVRHSWCEKKFISIVAKNERERERERGLDLTDVLYFLCCVCELWSGRGTTAYLGKSGKFDLVLLCD